MDLLEELQTSVLCGDGALGTLLMSRGVQSDHCFEALCLTGAEAIGKIHSDYIAAGSRIIETNSFGANAVRLARYNLENRVNEINWQAAQIAKQAAKGKNVYVAGSVGPLGLSPHEAQDRGIDRAAVFREQIGALLDGGVNLIFLETFDTVEELSLALHITRELHHCPVLCSMTVGDSSLLADGTNLLEAFLKLAAQEADILGLNCIHGPRAMLQLLGPLPMDPPLAVYPNAGRPAFHHGRFVYETSPTYFAEAAVAMVQLGARIIGGCCGTTPEHIAAVAEAIANLKPITSKVSLSVPGVVEVREASKEPPSAWPKEPNLLDRVAEGKRVILTELDPPKSLALEKYIRAATALVEAGSDAITLADNSLAILRVSNLAVGAMLKQKGVIPLLHLSCRDRNLLGLQSDLMGMAALGMRHVLPLTGDPAKVGDHPGATSVYDVNSIKLIEIICRLNEGTTQSGTNLKVPPNFVIGCTFNPGAKNLDAQVNRLERKIAAGAQYVMTQPVFDTALVKRTAEKTAHLNVPIFIGVWPLLNGRQAKFLHNEVPGITIPENVLSKMNGKEGVEGQQTGIEIAKEVAKAVLDSFSCGVYLITPFHVYESTAELAAFVRSLS